MPTFSIVIPTRERHRTLRYAMASVLAQTNPDFELVVMDNVGGPPTAEVVASFEDARVRHIVAPRRLAMSENWELGLSHAKGEFIFVLGDDDALLPDGIERVAACLAKHDVPIVAWPKNVRYWWSDAIVPHHRNRLYIDFFPDAKLRVLDARRCLERFYDGDLSYEGLPSLYSGFVHRSVVDKVRERHGRYFLSSVPDVYSAIVNAYFVKVFAGLPVGASLSGNSGASTGTSVVNPNLGSESRDRFDAENKGVYPDVHPALVPGGSLELLFANECLRARESFFPRDERLIVHIDRLIGAMLGTLSRNPDLYDVRVAEVNALAQKHGVTIPPEVIPPNVPATVSRFRGLYRTPVRNQYEDPNGGATLAVDCDVARIHDVAAAARLAAAMMPAID